MTITRTSVKRRMHYDENLIISNARDSGIGMRNVQMAISNISRAELVQDIGDNEPVSYVDKAYFNGTTSQAENIILALFGSRIVGFIITTNQSANTSYVAYLAVDSTAKKCGIGTKLMLAAMESTQELGKRYLTLEYIKGGLLNEERSLAKERFYNSFSQKFGIPMKEIGETLIHTESHIYPRYDLRNIDFNNIES